MSPPIMAICLHILCRPIDIPLVSPDFYPALLEKGWGEVWPYFAANWRGRYRTLTRPWKTSETTIVIPCQVKHNHWVAVVRKEVNKKVRFLYSDHLNCPATEKEVMGLFSKDTIFHPTSATWLNCPSNYYSDHYSDSGPISMLALITMATHPTPHRNLLLPYMHPNITQICRFWAATTLMFDHYNVHPIITAETNKIQLPDTTAKISSEIDWSGPTTSEDEFIPAPPITECFTPPALPTYIHTSHSQPNTVHKENTELQMHSTSTIHFKTCPTNTAPENLLHEEPSRHIATGSQEKDTCTVLYNNQPHRAIQRRQNEIRSNTISQKVGETVSIRRVRQHTLHHYLGHRAPDSSFPTLSNSTQDDHTFGHALTEIDATHTFHLILQNPNGFNLQENPEDFSLFLQHIASLGAGYLGIVETNIYWTQQSHPPLAHSLAKRYFSASTLIPSSHPEPFLSPVKAGGILSILTDKWVSHLIGKGVGLGH
jgi:hypothetical protein